jgi:hypothetical protein
MGVAGCCVRRAPRILGDARTATREDKVRSAESIFRMTIIDNLMKPGGEIRVSADHYDICVALSVSHKSNHVQCSDRNLGAAYNLSVIFARLIMPLRIAYLLIQQDLIKEPGLLQG